MKLGFVSCMKKMKTESSYENQSQEERKEERWSIAVSHGLTYHFFISQQNHIMFTKAFSSLGPFTLSLLSHHLLLLSWQNQLFSLLFPSSSSSNLEKRSHIPLPFKDKEDNSFPKQGKGWKKRNVYMAGELLCMHHKFNKGGKSLTFLTYNGSFGATNQIVALIQLYDVAFRDEDSSKSFKICNVAVHLMRSTCQC